MTTTKNRARVAYGLGANLGDPAHALAAAAALLRRCACRGPGRIALSDATDLEHSQPDFLNTVVVGFSGLPRALLDLALDIEALAGRQRRLRDGPRVLDIDLLLCGDLFRTTLD